MSVYIHQLKKWPSFIWDSDEISPLLSEIKFSQGKVLGTLNVLGFQLMNETMLQTLTLDVLKSSEIEGEQLDSEQVRSSIARRLGLEVAGTIPSDRNVEGIVEIMLDATQNYTLQLNKERLFSWHTSLFPTGKSGRYSLTVANWRINDKGPMQVVSGPIGRESVHFEAPEADRLEHEMNQFLNWLNADTKDDALLKAGLAHLWFVTIHPFDDGNGRIARAIADGQLAKADKNTNRFYSVSAQIRLKRKEYYEVLEQTQKGDLDVTEWLMWFLNRVGDAVKVTEKVLEKILEKAKFWEQNRNVVFNERQQVMLNKLLDGFDGKLNSSKWAKIMKVSSDTALRDINDLLNKKILIKETSGGRSTFYTLEKF